RWSLTSGFNFRIQPLHVIRYAALERELRLVTKRAPYFVKIGFGEVLVMGMRILDVIGLKFRSETFIERVDQFVERARLAGAEIVDSALLRFQRENASLDHVFHINEIALLVALFENARPLARLHLLSEMINHARRD